MRVVKRNSPSHRHTFLHGLAAARATERGTSAEKEILMLEEREKQRTEWRLIRSVEGKLRGRAVSMVIAPNEQNQWVERTDKAEIEAAVFGEAERRFNQASDTPFLQEPLLSMVGPLGTGPAAEAILSGTFEVPDDIDVHTAKFIKQLRRPSNATQMSLDLPN